MIFVLILITSAVLAQTPLIVTPESARAMLAGPLVGDEVKMADIKLHDGGSGLLYFPTFDENLFRSARELGRALNERSGHTLVLIREIDGISAPGFDGLVLDQNRRVIANFAMRRCERGAVHYRRLEKTFRQADEFALFKSWPRVLMRAAFTIAEQSREDDPSSVRLTEPYLQKRLLRHARAFRQHCALFGVGTDRPTWILVHANLWRPEWADRLTGLIPRGSRIERVHLLHEDQLIDLTADCQANLI